MAGLESVLLTQCLSMVNEFVTLKMHASLSVKIGDVFDFNFSNHNEENVKKKLSPSQVRRNQLRNLKHMQSFMVNNNAGEVKKENIQSDMVHEEEHRAVIESSDYSSQTETVEFTDCGTNTEVNAVEVTDCGINTEVAVANCGTNTEVIQYENILKVDPHGKIHPSEGESLVEVRVSHEAQTWEDVGLIIKKMGLKIIGRPWIASTGNLFKTIGLRIGKEDFEKWKLSIFNWQESGVRKVTFSRLCR